MPDSEGGEIGAPPRRRARRLSALFTQIAENATGNVSVATIRDELGDRSFAALLVFFAAVNMLPLPPGTSAVLGLPLMIVSAQMLWGSKRLWLPQTIAKRAISADQFRTMMAKVVPWMERVERLIRPRYWPFWRKQGDRVIGAVALVMATSVTLPIPLGNWMPAFCTFLLGLALSERDGILLALGSAVGIAALCIIAAVVGTAGFVSQFFLEWMGWLG
ncbi:exopolysaccharide biosynthesis protein [Mesorhizobium sp. RP14(2022)]|uniref:Exopolysaccharide biosynthesis protein n=1 Tax=Mesorhizobium liriopis TaxID=2953882 RepID=A0ABT1C5I6_9HYPH|nr:exopolysaccharide biosynthesis protein [Mesorhizobium liriopis]MCO6050088.1 exopolysaccharide biosynthesis protein [Mesorhizobium liriopis]